MGGDVAACPKPISAGVHSDNWPDSPCIWCGQAAFEPQSVKHKQFLVTVDDTAPGVPKVPLRYMIATCLFLQIFGAGIGRVVAWTAPSTATTPMVAAVAGGAAACLTLGFAYALPWMLSKLPPEETS